MNSKRLLTGVLLIGALVAAIAGGTYAIFTDTAGSQDAQFQAGTIDLEIDVDSVYYENEFPLDLTDLDLKPGDEQVTELSIHNKGENPFWLQMYVIKTPPWDAVYNLWDAPCNMKYEVTETGGPMGWNLLPSEVKYVTIKVSLPIEAPNTCQGGQADLRVLFVAKQKDNIEGIYDCMALENKDGNWNPIVTDGMYGEICYKVGSPLDVVLNAYGLTAGQEYQVTLNGPGGCTVTDLGIGDAPPSVNYIRGFWNLGPNLDTTCNSTSPSAGEGVYNFGPNLPYGSVTADADGNLSLHTQVALASGSYSGVKVLVKEAFGTWQTKLMEVDTISFTITP